MKQTTLPIRKKRKTYAQEWESYENAKTNEKEMFMELSRALCDEIEKPEYKFGRPSLSLSDMIFCCIMKVYLGFTQRRFASDMKEAENLGLITKRPHHTSLSKYFNNPDITTLLKSMIERSAEPLKSFETEFALDSSGFSTRSYERWVEFKYRKKISMRKWIKLHIMCGVDTNIIPAVEITEPRAGDCPHFETLVRKTARNFDIKEIYADKAYLSVKNFRIAKDFDAKAYIPFRKDSVSNARKKRIWRDMYHYFTENNDDFMKHYHKRSNAETTFHMIKSRFGRYLRSKNKTAQINEALCKVLCHNICVIIRELYKLEKERKKEIGQNNPAFL